MAAAIAVDAPRERSASQRAKQARFFEESGGREYMAMVQADPEAFVRLRGWEEVHGLLEKYQGRLSVTTRIAVFGK